MDYKKEAVRKLLFNTFMAGYLVAGTLVLGTLAIIKQAEKKAVDIHEEEYR